MPFITIGHIPEREQYFKDLEMKNDWMQGLNQPGDNDDLATGFEEIANSIANEFMLFAKAKGLDVNADNYLEVDQEVLQDLLSQFSKEKGFEG